MEVESIEAGTMAAGTPRGVTEEPLVRETQWGAIRELRAQGRPRKAIARELGLDIKTVRKWLRQEYRRKRRERTERELDTHAEFLRGRAPEVGFNGKVLERELRERGWTGHYATLARHVAPWRKEWRGEPEAVVRFETGPGEQAQADWGTTKVLLGQEIVRVHFFTMVLGYSRRLFARGYLSEGIGSLLDAHEKAFEHFGGRTRTILYDNPRTIVLAKDENAGKVTWNATFKDRMDFYGVEMKLCRYYRAQTKGKVESGVKYVKRNALAGQHFRDLEHLNAQLTTWCLEVADQRVHGTTHERPAERFQREELVAVDLRTPPARERVETRHVPKDALVAVETNRYPVPFSWIGQEVTVRILFEEIAVHGPDGTTVSHAKLGGQHQVARWVGPPRSLPRKPATPRTPPRVEPGLLEGTGHVPVRSLTEYEALAEVAG